MTAEEMADKVREELYADESVPYVRTLGMPMLLALCEVVLVAGCTYDASDDPKDWCCDREPKERCDFCKARARLVELGLLEDE